MAIFFFVVFIAGVLIFILVTSNSGGARNSAFKEALSAYENHMLGDAMRKFQALLYEEPYNSIFHWYVAMCSLQRQEYTTAMYHLDSVLQINNFSLPQEGLPDVEDFELIGVHKKLLEIYEVLKLKDKIIFECENLMEIEPGNDEYPLKMADILINEKNYSEKTKEYAERALALNPKNGQAQFILSLIYLKSGEYDNAIQNAEKTIAVDKSNNDAYFILGISRYRQNLMDEAEKHFREASLCRYFRKSTAFYLAKLLISEGKFDYALPYAEEAHKYSVSIHEEPSLELDAKYLYANLLEKSDQYKEAFEIYKAIQNIQPDYQDVSKRLKYMTPFEMESEEGKPKSNLVEEFKTMRLEDFARHSEKIIENMGFKVKKLDLVNDQTVNMLVHEKNDPSKLTGVFVRRGIGIIQQDHIKQIEHFMSGMQVVDAILITPNDFNPAARKMAEKKSIKTVNGSNLQELLSSIEV